MEVPSKIQFAAQRLRDGHRVNKITVRDFLRHFGTERRGAVKVQAIRTILDSLGLATTPDFETAWIDGPLWLILKDSDPALATNCDPTDAESGLDYGQDAAFVLDGTPSAVEQAEEQADSAPFTNDPPGTIEANATGDSVTDDPTFRIGRLPAANKKLKVVNEHDTLTRAVTLLLENDFSQLPVMQGERTVKGVVTWKSIGARLALGIKCDNVADCQDEPRIVDSNRTLFDAIPTIVDHGYVLVRDQKDGKITGIVTASDLSLEFRAQSEPFLLLREVELHVRQLLAGKVNGADFDVLSNVHPPKHSPQNIADLTFGEYVRLVQHPAIWPKLGLRIDAKALTEMLEAVRIIRNDVMHFDPDPMTEDELRVLKRSVRFMQELYDLTP